MKIIMLKLLITILLSLIIDVNAAEQTLLPMTHSDAAVPMQAIENDVNKGIIIPEKISDVVKNKIEEHDNVSKKLITINYKDKPLVDIITELAAEFHFNIILPQINTLTTKVNYSIAHKVSLKEAWERLTDILDLAGYGWESRNNMLELVKVDKAIRQDPLLLFVNEPLENLPDTEDVIQVIFHLSNMRVGDDSLNLPDILKNLLSPIADIKKDDKSNALLLTDKSNYIKGAMQIILELDLNGIRESLSILPLYYTQSKDVENLFTNQIYKKEEIVPNSSYFPKNTKVIAITRNNALALMGTVQAIDKVRDFIIKYIDRPLESGESILHVYDLQYLESQSFVEVLTNFIKPSGSSGQSTTQGAVTGPRQDFKNVLIAAENAPPTTAIDPNTAASDAGGKSVAQTSGVQQGGNRLVIAAQKTDWVRIKKLIDLVDKPQPQVALEVLIVDLTINEGKILGSQIRNNSGANDVLSKNVNFQTTHLAPTILPQAGECPDPNASGIQTFQANALMANLLEFNANSSNQGKNIANTSPLGSLIISFNDANGSGIWNIWQILNSYNNATMLAQPFVITENNLQAKISISEMRLLPGPAEVQSGNGIIQKQEPINAAISIDLLPRINLNNNINLQIVVNVNEFLSTANNRITRVVQTNANIGNGEVLALGGLVKLTDEIDINETPLLGKIPIIGWFFKKEQKIKQKSNLMIFICPTIIEPKISGGVDVYSAKKLKLTENQLQDHLNFENLRDPITRWFFKPDITQAARTINDYVHGTLDTTFCDDTPECDTHPRCTTQTVTIAPQNCKNTQLKQKINGGNGNPLKKANYS